MESVGKKIERILEKKSFSIKAKENITDTLLFIEEHYLVPSYISISKNDCIKKYLKTLEGMKEYSVLELSNINDKTDIAEVFREGITETKENNGNLDYIEDRYIITNEGPYYPACTSFSWKREEVMYTLEEDEINKTRRNCYHELIRLSGGKNPFPISASIPFSFSIRKMLIYGNIATKESYLDLKLGTYQVEALKENSITLKICSEYSYPLYGMLYQIMQLLFGFEVMESFQQNDLDECDLFEILKEKYPKIEVEEIFAHIIYILSCYDGDSKVKYNKKKALETSIKHYQKIIEEKLNNIMNKIKSLEDTIIHTKKWLEDNREIEEEIIDKLGNQKKLEQAFYYQMKLVKEETLKKYTEGILSEEEYQESLKEYDREGTIENFRLAQKQDLKLMEKTMKEGEEKLKTLQIEMDTLSFKKIELEENKLRYALEKICVTNRSLLESAEYLKKACSKAIQDEYAVLSQDEQEENSVYLDKMKLFVHIKSQMVLSKTNKKNEEI